MKSFLQLKQSIEEKTLTSAEKKKREEVAQAIERENPGMPMAKKMAIATATAKKVAEDIEQVDELSLNTMSKVRDVRDRQMGDAYNKYQTAKTPSEKQAALTAHSAAKQKLKRVEGKITAHHIAAATKKAVRDSKAGYDPLSYRSHNEEIEQVDELKMSTVGSYMNKTVDPVYGMPKPTKKLKQRLAGMSRAHQRIIGNKPTSEAAEKVQMHKPGWMLRADPALGAKVKEKINLVKLRQKYMGKTGEEIAKMKNDGAK